MKKVLFLFIVLLFMAIGCSTETSENGESSTSEKGSLDRECYPNATCNKGLVCDTEHNVCVKDDAKGDNEDGDTDSEEEPSDGTNTAPEEGSDGGNSEPEDPQGYTESKYEDYVLFNGHGILFDYSEYEEKKGNVEGNLNVVFGGESYDLDLVAAFVALGEVIEIVARTVVDKETETGLSMSVYLLKKQIENILKFGADAGYEDEVGFAPRVEIYKHRHFEEEGFAYIKYIAAGKKSQPAPELAGEWYSDGRMMLFLDENLNIAEGEDFKLSFDADLTTDAEEILEVVSGDLGQCYDLESSEQIECPEDIGTKAGF